MTCEDICKIIEVAGANGVTELNIDKISIKFDNRNSIQSEKEPPSSNSVPANQSDSTEIENDIKLEKAEELSLMMIENPEKFEELLANDSQLLKEFEDSIED